MKPDIPGYTIIAELQRSPITVVYKAKQDYLDRMVLLKVLHTNALNDPEIRNRFLREAKACARLKHPNIVQIYDYGEQQGVPYFIMEFVEGKNLKQIILEKGSLSHHDAEYVFYELLKGLQYAHQQKVLHRDIKPANVLISDNGEVKLTDFGIATFADAPEITSSGIVLGTPAYMSPEQAKGESLGVESDLFSLGITCYEMIIGMNPFASNTTSETISNVLNETPPSIETIRADISQKLSNICTKLLQKEKQKRFQNTSEVLNAWESDGKKIAASNEEKQIENTPKSHPFRTYKIPAILGGIALSVVIFWLLHAFNGSNNKLITQSPIVIDSTAIKKEADSTQLAAGMSNRVNLPDQKEKSQAANRDSIIQETPSESVEIPASKNHDKGLIPKEIDSKKPLKNTRESETIPENEKKPGYLNIKCFPWATVWIDGKEYGETSSRSTLELPAGKHELRLVNPHLPQFTDTLDIQSGKTKTVSINLKEKTGKLELLVSPWAEVYIDNNYIDTTPLSHPVILKEGLHKIRLENPNYPVWEDRIYIVADKKTDLKVSLKK